MRSGSKRLCRAHTAVDGAAPPCAEWGVPWRHVTGHAQASPHHTGQGMAGHRREKGLGGRVRVRFISSRFPHAVEPQDPCTIGTPSPVSAAKTNEPAGI